MPDPELLPGREAAVLAALRAAPGRVLSRSELARDAGLSGLSDRRVDGVLAALRRRLPVGALITVRGRGWMLSESLPYPDEAETVHRVGTSRKHRSRFPETPAT